jgi:non-ribosomal peptide synthetase component F
MSRHPQLDGSVKAVAHPRCLQFSSISFDVAVFEWATTLSCGGCLCLVPSVDQLLGEALMHTVKRYGITTLLASASSVAAVPLNSGPGGSCLVDLSGLSFMSCGSEALQEAVLHRWMSACPAAFFNQYGPTEVTVTSHMCHYQPVTAFPFHNNRVIGGGITNVQSYV